MGPLGPIYLNVTVRIQSRRFELKLGPNRSVSVQIPIYTIQHIQNIENIENRKLFFFSGFLFFILVFLNISST